MSNDQPATPAEDEQSSASSAESGTPSGRRESRAERRQNDPLRHSRTSAAWVAVVGLAIVLILLVVFIVQNTQSVEVSFFGWSGSAPLSVSLLIATAAGLLLAGVAGSLRIFQLHRRVRRQR